VRSVTNNKRSLDRDVKGTGERDLRKSESSLPKKGQSREACCSIHASYHESTRKRDYLEDAEKEAADWAGAETSLMHVFRAPEKGKIRSEYAQSYELAEGQCSAASGACYRVWDGGGGSDDKRRQGKRG